MFPGEEEYHFNMVYIHRSSKSGITMIVIGKILLKFRLFCKDLEMELGHHQQWKLRKWIF